MIDRVDRVFGAAARHRHRIGSGAGDMGRVEHSPNSAGCAAGPQRHTGDSVFALGSQPGPHRRPGDLSDRHGHARGAEGQGSARCFRFRLLLRLRDLRGRDRPVLGAVADPGVSCRSALHPAGRSQNRTRAGCHRPGLGLSICLDGRLRKAVSGATCGPRRTSSCVITCAPFREWRKWLRWAGLLPQYQVTVDAARLRAMGIPFAAVVEAVRRSNVETGGRFMEFGGAEYMIRGRGYLTDPRELEEAVVAGGGSSQIVRVKDVGKVSDGTGNAPGSGRPRRTRGDRFRNRRHAPGRERGGRHRSRQAQARSRSLRDCRPGCAWSRSTTAPSWSTGSSITCVRH